MTVEQGVLTASLSYFELLPIEKAQWQVRWHSDYPRVPATENDVKWPRDACDAGSRVAWFSKCCFKTADISNRIKFRALRRYSRINLFFVGCSLEKTNLAENVNTFIDQLIAEAGREP